MTDYTELKRLAEAASSDPLDCIYQADQVLGHFSAAASPSAVLALIAENERLFKLLERTVEQYVPLTELEGVPGWSRVVELVEVVAQRDRLRAEVVGLKTGYEAYERVNADLKAENETLIAAAQALRDEWRKDQDDAKRYRWLIRNAEEIYFQGHHLHLDPYYVGQEKIKEDADSEIDAVLGQGEQS